MRKDIVPKDSRYVPLVQQRYCCAVACVLMVMYRHGIPLLSQEFLGYYLGLVVPQKDRNLYWRVRVGKEPSFGYGTQIMKKRYQLNRVFKKLRIPLVFKLHHISSFKNGQEIKDFLQLAAQEQKDIVLCFNYKKMYGTGWDGGHTSLVDKIYLKQGKLRIVDSARNVPKWRIISINKMIAAMKFHSTRADAAGFWELTYLSKV